MHYKNKYFLIRISHKGYLNLTNRNYLKSIHCKNKYLRTNKNKYFLIRISLKENLNYSKLINYKNKYLHTNKSKYLLIRISSMGSFDYLKSMYHKKKYLYANKHEYLMIRIFMKGSLNLIWAIRFFRIIPQFFLALIFNKVSTLKTFLSSSLLFLKLHKLISGNTWAHNERDTHDTEKTLKKSYLKANSIVSRS